MKLQDYFPFRYTKGSRTVKRRHRSVRKKYYRSEFRIVPVSSVPWDSQINPKDTRLKGRAGLGWKSAYMEEKVACKKSSCFDSSITNYKSSFVDGESSFCIEKSQRNSCDNLLATGFCSGASRCTVHILL